MAVFVREEIDGMDGNGATTSSHAKTARHSVRFKTKEEGTLFNPPHCLDTYPFLYLILGYICYTTIIRK